MKPWSCGSMACFPPAAMALSTMPSTSALLSHESAKSASVCFVVSQSSLLVNVLKNGSPRSMTYASSLMTMQAALSSVNCGSNPKPSFVKNSIDFFRSRTARLTNIFRGLLSAMVSGLLDPGVEHPAHAEGVGEHAELGAPERVVQG